MSSGSQSNSRPNTAPNLCSEQGRLDTFRCWPHSAAVEPGPLAKAGFYYLGQADKVRCAFCGGTLKSWQHGDDPAADHRKHFTGCAFIQGKDVGNIPLPVSPNSASSSGERVSTRGEDIGPSEGNVPANLRLNPRNPDYQSVDSRLASFEGWSKDIRQRPEALAHAGFFYTGVRDGVRCFCCDGALRSWEPGDDPWTEHARWFPRCPYLLQQKGRVFVEEIQDRNLALQFAEEERISENRQPLNPTSETEPRHHDLPTVFREVTEMGFEPARVQATLQRLLSSSGHAPTADQLIEAVLAENAPEQGSGEGSSLSPVSNNVFSPVAPSAASTASYQAQQSQEGDRTLCKICLDREVAVTFLPCGHLVCCAECAKNVKECPVCRQTVRASIRTYLC